MNGNFETSAQKKYRFETSVGNITTEDVWDLPLESDRGISLDALAKSLNQKIKDSAEESFVKQQPTINKHLQIKMDIVKRVIEVKLDLAEKKRNARKAKERKQQILQLIADKENDALSSLSLKDLRKMLDD